MQPQPPPQHQPLSMPRNGMLWGRAIRPPSHVVRFGEHWVSTDILRQRFTTAAADIFTCQELLARGGDVIAKNYDPSWMNKPRMVRALPGGEVGGFGGGGAGSVRNPPFPNQGSHPPPTGANQPPTNQQAPQLRSQGGGPPPGPNSHITLAPHNQVLQTGQPGLGNQSNQVSSVPPGASPAPQGPHDISGQGLTPGSTQQGSGGSIAVVSGGQVPGTMMFQPAASSQPQGPQQPPNQQSSYYASPHGNQNPSHIHSGNPRHVSLPSHMNFPLMQVPYPNLYYHQIQAPAQYSMQRPNTPQTQFPVQQHPGNYINPNHYHQTMFYSPSGNNQAPVKHVPQQEKRPRKVLEIVDPSTGKNILNDILDQENTNQDKTPPHTADNSARNTPASSVSNSAVVEFATKVASLANPENPVSESVDHERTTNKNCEVNSNIGRSNSDNNSRQLSKPLDNCNNICISETTQSEQHNIDTTNNVKFTQPPPLVEQKNEDNITNIPPPPVPSHQAPPAVMVQHKHRSTVPPQQQQHMMQQYLNHQPPVNHMITAHPPPSAIRHPVEMSTPPPKVVAQVPLVHNPAPVPAPHQEVVAENTEPAKPRGQKGSSPATGPPPPKQQQQQQQQQQQPPPPMPHNNYKSPPNAAPLLQSPPPAVVPTAPVKEPTPEPTRPNVQKTGSCQVPTSSVKCDGVSNVTNNNEDRKSSSSAYRGRRSKDKFARRGKGPVSPPSKSPVPRETTPVTVVTNDENVALPPPVTETPTAPVQAVTKEPSPEPVKVELKTKSRSPANVEPTPPEPAKKHVSPPPLEEPAKTSPPRENIIDSRLPAKTTNVETPKESVTEAPIPTPKIVEPVPTVTQAPPTTDNTAALVNNHTENHNHEEEIEEEEEEADKDDLQKYEYKDDQWSPLNQAGKKQYDRSFLLNLQNNPLSLKRPESLPNLEVVLHEMMPFNMSKMNDNRAGCLNTLMLNNVADVLAPNYVKGTRSSKGKPLNNRPSYQGKNPPKVIPHVIRIGSSEFRKLQISDNAWRPKGKDNSQHASEEAETADTLKKVRGILNKLTPDNFSRLLDKIKALPITKGSEVLSGVIDLIFEKAVDEQAFSTTYAQLCEQLSTCVKSDSVKAEKNFRFIIISRCQKEFEKDTMEELKEKWNKEIEAEPDVDKKEELRINYEYKEMILRKRSVGNIRFIGELYKLKMLNSLIMMRIIETLLKKADPESLECLCKLLTTIGAILESQAQSLQQPKAMEEFNARFEHMQRIITDKKTNSRVRFLMMDVVDLRLNNWVARREEAKPKTKAQVLEEVKREEEEEKAQIALSSNNRRDDRTKRNTRPLCEDGWMTQSRARQTFDSNRLKNNSNFSKDGIGLGKDLTFGRPVFGNWQFGSSGGGASIGSQDHATNDSNANRFNVLSENMHNEDRRGQGPPRLAPQGGPPRQGMSFGSKSMPPPSSDKESVLSAVKQMAAPADRSHPAQRSRETSLNREPEGELKGDGKMTETAAEKLTISIIGEFASICDFDEAKICVTEGFHSKTVSWFVQFAVEWVLDKDKKKRKLVGQLFHYLIKTNVLLRHQFLEGNKEGITLIEDYIIDVPQICEYYGELLAPLLVDDILTFKQMYELSLNCESKKADLFASIAYKASEIMPTTELASLWKASQLNWADIVPSGTDVEEFIRKHKVDFLTSSENVAEETGWTLENVKKELSKLFRKEASNEDIMRWIQANIAEFRNSNKNEFIRALVMALVESLATTSSDGSSITLSKYFDDAMKNRVSILVKYVDSDVKLEMQCIYELQAFSVRHQHPPGMLERLFFAFYDNEVVSEEVFGDWEDNTNVEEQEGKGVCVKSVQKFLKWLKSDDETPT